MVIVGAGILGINQLYRAVQAGYSVVLLEQAEGVGGTWYWNRYPGCRFDSESYTYGYLFSEELWQEWDWSEEFAPQPETERYLNHVVDKFDLRRHIRTNSKVNSSVWDEEAKEWTTGTEDGFQVRSRYLIAATGVLSVPQYPDVPGREDFRGQTYHPVRWPKEPVDFRGKRVAVIGTGSTGVQIGPAIADEVESLVMYQRSATWATPLNNHPIDAEQQAYLKANFAPIKDALDASVGGFLHKQAGKKWTEDTPEQRQEFFEAVWNSPGFAKISTNYDDLIFNPEANADWCAFMAGKIREIVKDPAVAEKLIPTDHLYVGLRPPYVTGYYEMYNKPNVELVSLRETPIVKVTETGIETSDGLREFDIIIWATGFDFGSGAMLRMGIVGAGRPAARRLLGRRAAHLPRHHDPRVPELLLPRRPARRRGQQPALRRAPDPLRPGPHRPRPRARAAPDRGAEGSRAGLDGHDRPVRGLLAVPEAGPVLRRQHPGQATGVPAQPGREAEA